MKRLRLPYRVQIPLGLALAVLITALFVTAVGARLSARDARAQTLATLDRAMVLLVAQARPLLAADDTWRVFSLLRDTVALLPGADRLRARVAVLDAQGRVFAASNPAVLETGRQLLGETLHGQPLLTAEEIQQRQRIQQADGGITLVDPISSEDGQLLGFVLMDVDAPVFAPNWAQLARPALIGMGLAVVLLIPAGWWLGRRVTAPVAGLARFIHAMEPAAAITAQPVPHTDDPELQRIARALHSLQSAWEERRRAEQRALSAERLAAVGRMTAAVAHEINNPLAGLLTAIRTLRLHGDAPQARERALDVIEHGLMQIRTTVAALLPQARVQDRPLEPSDFDDVLTLAQPAAQAQGVSLSARSEVESALRVPSAPVRQAMLNMLLNAIRAAGPGGRVAVQLLADAEQVRFCVTNSGTALDPQRFAATLAQEGGDDPRGFGIWVCQQIANHHRGGFTLDPDYRDGTRLVFWLPNREID